MNVYIWQTILPHYMPGHLVVTVVAPNEQAARTIATQELDRHLHRYDREVRTAIAGAPTGFVGVHLPLHINYIEGRECEGDE